MTLTAQQIIDMVLADGGDPRQYRLGIAERAGVPVEQVDALIAAAGAPEEISDEMIAQRRLAEERRVRHSREYKVSQHEED